MKKTLVALAFMFVSAFATAGPDVIYVDKLTEVQRAELMTQVAQMKEAATNTPRVTTEDVDKYIKIGAQIGQMVGGAAKELGVAVNEFLKTPAGLLATSVIVFQYIGSPVMHFAGGLLILFVGIFVVSQVRRSAVTVKVKYNTEKRNLLGNHPVLSREVEGTGGESAGGYLFAYLLVFIGAGCTMFGW